MYQFTSLESFITPALKARGIDRIYVVKNVVTFEKGHSPYMNEQVMIDGLVKTCVGVETFALTRVPDGVHIALAVKE